MHGMKNYRVDLGKIRKMEHFVFRFSSLLGKVKRTEHAQVNSAGKKIIPDDTR